MLDIMSKIIKEEIFKLYDHLMDRNEDYGTRETINVWKYWDIEREEDKKLDEMVW